MLSKSEVKHIAKLAKLNLSEEEITKYSQQLSSILAYSEMLQEVNTDNIQPLAQITGLQNIKRTDEVLPQNLSEALLQCSPQGIEQGQIRVKSVF